MSFLSKIFGGETASTAPTGRTPKERARRAKEIRKIDAGTAAWLNRGGFGPRNGR